MKKTVILYNPLAGRETNVESLSVLKDSAAGEPSFCDITDSAAYNRAMADLQPEDTLILCGGDGTLNRFVNTADIESIQGEILYYPCGSGNDFANDLGKKQADGPFSIKKYIKALPYVEVNGKKHLFINGIGYGIDGYCCEVGDRLKQESDKPINYAAIAVKGLLFHYKPTAATVTVDGQVHRYKKVWLAPTMNGRFYGGGMMPTPKQDRLGSDGLLSVMVFHDSGKIKTLTVFPGIFKGEHVAHTDVVEVLTGREISVEFDRPTALQIDGETVTGVTGYRAFSALAAEADEKQPALAD